MKKFAGILAVLAIVVVLVAAVVGFVVFKNLDRIVRRSTEEALTYALMVPCKVGGASVDVRKGIVELTGIEIPNPPGFDSSHAMKFGTVRVEADIKSFRTDEPVIRNVHVSKADIVLEKSLKTSNLQTLMDNAGRFSAGKESPAPEEEPKEGGKAVKIERVLVEGTTVRVALPLAGGRTLGVPVPAIEMKDIGGKKKKTSPAEALQEFIARLLAGIADAGAGILPKDLLGDIGESLSDLPGDIQQGLGTLAGETSKALDATVGTVGDITREAGKAAEDAAKAVGGAIGGLLGGKKKSGS